MSEKITPLTVVTPLRDEPQPQCILALERALERARAGHTVGVLIVEQGPDDTAGFVNGGNCGSYAMLGVLQVAQSILLSDHIEGDW